MSQHFKNRIDIKSPCCNDAFTKTESGVSTIVEPPMYHLFVHCTNCNKKYTFSFFLQEDFEELDKTLK